jgi:hypothetical protein
LRVFLSGYCEDALPELPKLRLGFIAYVPIVGIRPQETEEIVIRFQSFGSRKITSAKVTEENQLFMRRCAVKIQPNLFQAGEQGMNVRPATTGKPFAGWTVQDGSAILGHLVSMVGPTGAPLQLQTFPGDGRLPLVI